MIKTLILFLSLFSATFCWAQTKTENDLYVAGYRNEDFNTAYLAFLKKKNDSLYFFSNDESQYNAISLRSFEKDTLGIQTKFSVTNNKIALYYTSDQDKQDYHYFKVEDAEFTIDQVREIKDKRYTAELDKVAMIPNRDLKIQREIYFLDSSNVEITYTYSLNNKILYSERETSNLEIFAPDNKFFFSFYNGELSLNNRWYQLTNLQKDKFSFVHYAETKKIVDVYTVNPAKNQEINSSNFKMCLDSRPYEYYNYEPDIKYTHGNNALLKRLIKDAPSTKGNGFITIHFAINCEGNVGRFGLEQMDTKYQSASYDPQLIKHLIQEISKITEWNLPEKIQTDTHRFFMFKVTNGKITEVWP